MSADLHHLAAAYALDALDDVERQEFERHYESCDQCRADVTEFRAVAGELAGSTAVPAPDKLRSAVMAEVTQTRQQSPLVATARPAGGIPRQLVFAVAAALVLLGGVLAVTLPGGNSDDDRMTELVESNDAVVTSLDSLTGDQSASLQIIWSDERDQVAVVGSRLDDPGVNKAYALWFLLPNGDVEPAGLFQPVDGSVSELLDVDDIELNGWGITIEPDTGSAQPTTAVIFAGTI